MIDIIRSQIAFNSSKNHQKNLPSVSPFHDKNGAHTAICTSRSFCSRDRTYWKRVKIVFNHFYVSKNKQKHDIVVFNRSVYRVSNLYTYKKP